MTDPLNLAGIKLGNYRLHKVLGRGNMGAVYLATDEALLRPTAVKVLTWSPAEHDPEAWFLAEARNVAKLNHPSVVQIYSVARHGPYCYIAMEYVEGMSAEVMVTRHGPLSPERATEVILQLAAALELAHVSGIIHRDVKPGNILIHNDGTAKLGDFGMAVSDARSQSRQRAGTPHYFAPEIWRGEPASISTDLYALGATYYYLLAGRPPLDGSTIAGLSVAHQRDEVVVPPELATACMRVVRRCLAKSPEERYESARAVAWDARGVLRELASPSSASQPMPVLRRPDTVPPQQSLTQASVAWRTRGFLFEPFAEVDPLVPPYRREAFDSEARDLAARLARSGTTVIVAGAPGTGRSVLARSVAMRTKRGTYVDLDRTGSRPGSLVQRIARAFGAIASPAAGSNAEIEGLLELLAAAPPSDSVPLIVVDGVVAGTAIAADVALLSRAARSTRYFSLLVVGSAELAAELSTANPACGVVSVLPLTLRQVGAYIDAWLVATRAPEAPPLPVTVDAALLVGRRTEGNLRRINSLTRQMIARGGPIVTSWDAWVAPDDGTEGGPRPARPVGWPTSAALQLINQCRAAAGLGERGSDL